MAAAGLVTPIISAVAALAGVYLASWLSDRRERERRQTEFLVRRLVELYGPLMSIRAEILAHKQLLAKMDAAADGRDGEPPISPSGTLPELMGMTEDEIVELRQKVVPAYRTLVSSLRERLWLADPSTREHLPALIGYVESWERSAGAALPGHVQIVVGQSQRSLARFFRNVETTHDRLQHIAVEGTVERVSRCSTGGYSPMT
jgi:hypothetical protein